MSEPTTSPIAGDWESLARSASDRQGGIEEREEAMQLLAFSLDDAPYAIPVERVRVIVRMCPVTPMPRVANDIRGVISLRGEVVQVIDLRRRLGLSESETTRQTRIIVVTSGDGRITGMLVDRVTEVLRVGIDAMRTASPGEAGVTESLCVKGDRFISMLDLDGILAIDADC